MRFTYEKFERLVRREEEYARRHPTRHRVRLALLAALGYAYVLLVLGLAVGGVGLAVWVAIGGGMILPALLLGFPSAIVTLFLVSALRIRPGPTLGLVIPPGECPRLHEAIAQIRAALQATAMHHVVLIPHFGAGAAQIPRFGFLGWRQNHLFLGFPLMHVLSPDQLRAVIAHEFAHLSRNHAPFSGWIYRVRLTWGRLTEMLDPEDAPWWARPLTTFARWYWPRFNAHSFVLARADERVADRCGLEVTDARTTGEALIITAVVDRYLDEVLDREINRRADDLPEPPDDLLEEVARRLRTDLTPERGERWFEQALRHPTDYADTHPCLADRLAAIRYAPRPDDDRWRFPPVEETAAGVFLAEHLPEWTRQLGQFWKQQLAEGWKKRHEHAQVTREKLARLEEKRRTRPLEEDEEWLLAHWTADVRSEDEAIPRLREIVQGKPDHSIARATLGMFLLQREDPEGIEHVEAALPYEPDLTVPGLEQLARFARHEGRMEDAEAYVRRLRSSYDRLTDYVRERRRVRKGDEFFPHDLSPAWVRRICASLPDISNVQEAYLLQKRVKHFPEKPLYVLSIVTTGDPYAAFQQLMEKLEFPGQIYILLDALIPARMRYDIARVAGEPVYRKPALDIRPSTAPQGPPS